MVDIINGAAPKGFVAPRMNPPGPSTCKAPSGTYWFAIVISAEGNLLEARPLTGKGLSVNECLTKSVTHYTFSKPATLRGEPVAVKMLVTFQIRPH